MVSIEDRSAIVAYHKRGMPIPVIAKTLKLHREQVHRVFNRYQETGEVKDRHRSGRSRTARTPALREKVRHKIQRDPQRSIRKLAKEHDISHESMRQLVREDLRLVVRCLSWHDCLAVTV
ncbi:hypothetical protein QR680_009540 [Steinernema hermaphroditum]|uniref:Paired domain-containing protein n=1 Tax=Steinernema hermaphroditum TaxID=289476 RepID=A0AA39IM38_9BILA|nr:hypothetical protein QR680_009540 [Steinernema hermaphroditum]